MDQSAHETDTFEDATGSPEDGADSRLPEGAASDQQYRDIFNAVSDGLLIIDLETELVLESNPAACRMHGHDDMTSMPPSAYVHPDSFHLFAAFAEALRAGKEYRCRAQDVRKDGSVVDIEVLGRLISYYGQPAMLGVVRDVTEQVRAYQLLERRVEERTIEIERRRRVAEGMRELIGVVNSQHSTDEILSYLVEQARTLLECDASAVFLPFEERGDDILRIRASSGLGDQEAAVRMPLKGSPTGLAFSRRKSVYVTNLRPVIFEGAGSAGELVTTEESGAIQIHRLPFPFQAPERGSEQDPSGGLYAFATRFGALFSVPLISNGIVYGTLSLYYCEPKEFSADEISLATTFAGQAAVALENARLREQASQAAVLEERQRLARELHDSVTQTLFSASLISEVVPDLWKTNPDEGRRRLDQLRKLTRSALAEMRLLLIELRPTALTDISFADLLRQLVEAAAGTTNAEFSVEMLGDMRARLEPDAQVGLYRIAQEALNNITKHAKARKVSVTLDCKPSGRVDLVIRDDGQGFDLKSIPAGHLGVGIMRERAAAIGAKLNVKSAPGNGTEIRLTWRGGDVSAR